MNIVPLLTLNLLTALSLQADETPYQLGTSDLAKSPRLDYFKPSTLQVINLKKAFEIEAVEQLDLAYAFEALSELEILKLENDLLKNRVSELERRLAVVEAKLKE